MRKTKLFKISFVSNGKSYELYARHVSTSELWGFTQVSDLVFAEAGSSVLVDPSEERLREEFGATRVLHLPMHSVLRVEEVASRGSARIRDAEGGSVTPFPLAMPGRKPET